MNETLFLNKKMVSTWANIIERCYNSKSPSYYWYGERGIKMCERWQSSVANFIADMGLPPTLTHSIDRIDCNGDYEPSNCRWATAAEQNNNTRRSKLIAWNGKTQSIRDWAKEYNIGSRAVSERLRRGWSLEKSLKTPGRISFEKELADRRERGDKLWKAKGKLYQAHSKQRRGHKLSFAEQKAIEAEKSQATALAAQINIEMQEKYKDLAIEFDSANMLHPSITDLHKGGIASLRIAQHFNVPLGVVDLIIERNDNCSTVPVSKKQKILPSKIHEVLSMRKKGKTIRHIAKLTGIPKSTVHWIISKEMQVQPAL